MAKGHKHRILRVALWTLMAAVLLVAGLIVGIYTPWLQNRVRLALIERLSDGGRNTVTIDDLSLRFPLQLDMRGFSVVDVASGDTMMAAATFRGDVEMLPLLRGDIDIAGASVTGARYQIGTADSTLYLVARIPQAELEPCQVRFGKKMDINLSTARARGGRVDIVLSPDTILDPTPPEPNTQMAIHVKRLELDDFTYTMRMMPIIDSLGAHVEHAVISDGLVDLAEQRVEARDFSGTRLRASYIFPDSAAIAATPVAVVDSTYTPPWVVKVGHIGFDKSWALYAEQGWRPLPGMDFSYLEFDNVDMDIHDFYNRSYEVRVPVSRISATERSGVVATISGTLDIDSTAMYLRDVDIASTRGTHLRGQGMMGLLTSIVDDPSTPWSVKMDGDYGIGDAALMFPDAAPLLSGFGTEAAAALNLDAEGSLNDLLLRRFDLGLAPSLRLALNGSMRHLTDFDRLEGDINISGAVKPDNAFRHMLTQITGPADYVIPPLTIDGHATMRPGVITGDMKAVTGQGSLALDAQWRQNAEAYDVELHTRSFPVHAFMPALGVGPVTADLNASGHGFDFFSPATQANIALKINELAYDGHTYRDISLNGNLSKGLADLALDICPNRTESNVRARLNAHGNLDGDTYRWSAALSTPGLNLKNIGVTAEPMTIIGDLDLDATISPANKLYAANLDINSLKTVTAEGTTDYLPVALKLNADRDATDFSATNGDLSLRFRAQSDMEQLMTRFGVASDSLAVQMKRNRIDLTSLHPILPPLNLDFSMGAANDVAYMLRESDMSLDRLSFHAANDSILSMRAQVLGFRSGDLRLDSITARGWQSGRQFLLEANVDNRPGTLDEFAHIALNGSLSAEAIQLMATQRNLHNKIGYQLGLMARALPGGRLMVTFRPTDPIIAYKQWSINDDNFIVYDFLHKHLDADLHMEGGGSSLALYTEHGHDDDGDDDDDDDDADGHHHDHSLYEELASHRPDALGDFHDEELASDTIHMQQEDVILKIKNIHLEDWLAVSPFAPPVKGNLSADLHVNWDDKAINGAGTVNVDQLFYGRDRVGDFRADLDLSTTLEGQMKATADLFVDGQRTVTIAGNINDADTESPFNLNFSMIRFPLAVANPFLPADMAQLRGMINGSMQIGGDASHPRVNGFIAFDDAAVTIPMVGASYTFSTDSVPVRDNVVRFDDFAINGVNSQPLLINGKVDINNPVNAKVDLSFKGQNIQLVNTKKAARGASIYGKAFINLDASARGDMRLLNVNATLDLLQSTNVSYILPDAETFLDEQATADMVKFVNFNGPIDYAEVDSIAEPSMQMDLNAVLRINNGAVVNVDLNSNGSNRVQLQPSGTLNYTLQPMAEEGRLTGRLNINKGFVRYSNMIISEKYFTFNEGSYVNFTGDMMNPALNIHAVDVLKANVTQEGQNSRLVNFDVSVGVTGTLENMNVAFDLATTDDITIANELQGMGAEQRASQAMNMLLYGVYTGPGTKGSANLQGNLYSFLASQLNSWAASNIHGVDISFGIDQYNRTFEGSTSQTTSYSYRVSKSLFDDRFKIVVGGNYSTDANADENFSQNLISDISFEYLLNQRGTMLVRLFRHTGYESILEGEVTQTGVGFVYKRKIRKISDMFRPFRRRRTTPAPEPAASPKPEATNPQSESSSSDK